MLTASTIPPSATPIPPPLPATKKKTGMDDSTATPINVIQTLALKFAISPPPTPPNQR